MRVPHRKAGKFTYIKLDPRITAKKLAELKADLEVLKKKVQPKLASEVKRLALGGDFSENTAYQMAKGQLRGINSKIEKIAKQIAIADIIEPVKDNSLVQIGSLVILKSTKKTVQYIILGSLETDPAKGIISYSSPLGENLMNKKIGDTIELKSDGKSSKYEIIKIE